MKPVVIYRRTVRDEAIPGQHFRRGMSNRTFCLLVALIGSAGLFFSTLGS